MRIDTWHTKSWSKKGHYKIGPETRIIKFIFKRFVIETWWLPPKSRDERNRFPQYRIRHHLLILKTWGENTYGWFRTFQLYLLGHEFRLTVKAK